MDLLPRSHKELASASYWETFFRKRGQKAFEWYGEYPELCGVLHKYIKPKDKVLHIGCGNSKLSVDLFDIGYKNIINIDISDTVIKQMNEQYRSTRPDLKFTKMDICEMDFEDGEFNVVLDKATLDAVFADTNESTLKTVNEMFGEIGRVLRVGGRFVCFSLAQDHILKKISEHFPNEGWMTRICYVSQGDTGEEKDFHMPVFAYIFTKFKKMPNMKPILEIAPFEDKVERLESTEKLLEAVKQLQNYGILRQQLNKGTGTLDEHVSLDLFSADNAKPRYTLHVVDSKTAKRNKFAIFIVPQGRENERMFSDKDGRQELCESAGFQRLVVVTLHRQHTYDCMSQVKEELSQKVMELAPEKVNPKQVPYLSLGDSISLRTIRHEGESALYGPYVVEDVQIDADVYRRLVFLNRPDVIEAEIKLAKEHKGKRGDKSPSNNTLCQQHDVTMLAGLAFVQDLDHVLDNQLDVLMIGMRAGVLSTFISKHLKKAFVEVIEHDAGLISIAKDWFNFKQSERLVAHTENELQFVQNMAAKGEKKHVVVLDINGSGDPSTVEKLLLETCFIEKVVEVLQSTGVFVFHISTKDDDVRDKIFRILNTYFKAVYSKPCFSHRQDLIIAGLSDTVVFEKDVSEIVKSQLKILEKHSTVGKEKLDLVEALEGLNLSDKKL